jgi:hypothetical protein
MLTFDKNKDGKLTKEELTEKRLHGLFERADADKDGTVTRGELTALAAREMVNQRGGRGGFGPPGFGPPGGPMMGMPRPGDVLPPMVRQRLRLSEEQKEQIDALQKEVDGKLAKILNSEQRQALQRMRERPGPPGGFGGPPPGGPGGPPPGGPPGGPPDEAP